MCTDCHGAHDILTGADPKSPIAKANVPATCGKCHADVQAEYVQSIHGTALAKGNWQSPVCTDCHGIHTIKAPNDPNSAVAAGNVGATCASCHASVKLSSEFGVAGNRVSTVPGQLSRHGVKGRICDCRELRQLPWSAQHPAVERPALHHQPCQPSEDMRAVPSGSQRESSSPAKSTSMACSRPTSAAKSLRLSASSTSG